MIEQDLESKIQLNFQTKEWSVVDGAETYRNIAVGVKLIGNMVDDYNEAPE